MATAVLQRERWSEAERKAWAVNQYASKLDWAEARFVLPSSSPEPGPFDASRTPYIRRPLEAVSNPSTRVVMGIAGTQLFKTTFEMILVMEAIDQDPSEILFLMGRDEDIETFSVNRLKPAIKASPALAAHIKSETRELTREKISLNGTTVYLDTASSPAATTSKPVRKFMGDEIHLWPDDVGGLGSPWYLGLKRISNYSDGQAIGMTTPSDDSMVAWQVYMEGTQEEWHMRCVHCRELIEYEFGFVKWPKEERNAAKIRDERLAWYECQKCGGVIGELEKDQALQGGDYISKNKHSENPSHVSFQVSGMASPWRTWSSIAAEFLECGGDPEKLKQFRNTVEGKNWEQRVSKTIKAHELMRLADGPVPRGVLPNETQMLTVGADCHGAKKGFYWSAWAWGHGRRRWLVDWGQCFTLADLILEIDNRQWVTPEGLQFAPMVGVDSAYETAQVYKFIEKLYPSWQATRGLAELSGAPIREVPIDYFERQAQAQRGGYRRGAATGLGTAMALLEMDVTRYKDELANQLNWDPEEEAKIAAAAPEHMRGVVERTLWLPAVSQDEIEEFLEHLASEVKVRIKKNDIWVKRKPGEPNHWWDTAIIARAVAEKRGLLRLPALESAAQGSQGPSARGQTAETGEGRGGLDRWRGAHEMRRH